MKLNSQQCAPETQVTDGQARVGASPRPADRLPSRRGNRRNRHPAPSSGDGSERWGVCESPPPAPGLGPCAGLRTPPSALCAPPARPALPGPRGCPASVLSHVTTAPVLGHASPRDLDQSRARTRRTYSSLLGTRAAGTSEPLPGPGTTAFSLWSQGWGAGTLRGSVRAPRPLGLHPHDPTAPRRSVLHGKVPS